MSYEDKGIIKEFKEGSIIVEVIEKKDYNGKTLYDMAVFREFEVDGNLERDCWFHYRDLLDVLLVLVRAQKYMLSMLRGIKAARYRENPKP